MSSCLFASCIFASSAIMLLTLILTLSTNDQNQAAALCSQEFGIGFDLTPSYGTVAIAYPNGSTYPIAKVDGDETYKEMMYRLSLDSSKSPHQPYRRVGDGLLDWPRHSIRSARKKLGLPASYDVGVLSRMIAALQREASTFVDERVTAAAISIPFLVALYGEDTVDAFEYLSINNMEVYNFKDYNPIYSVSSVHLLNGHELVPCTGDSDKKTCPTTGQTLRESVFEAMTVSYTHSSLLAGYAYFSTCYSEYKYGDMSFGFANMNLGYSARHEARDDEAYWKNVKDFLYEAVKVRSSSITKIILWGDTAAEPKFLETLMEAVNEALDCKELEFITHDPLYSGARGSAQFAMRALNGSADQRGSTTEQAEL